MTVRSFGQYGNRYIQRGLIPEFGHDGFDQGKYANHINPYSQNSGPGYHLGWNGYQRGNIFNPYQKLGYGYQNQGYSGGLGFADSSQMFGVPQPTQPVNLIGNQRIRI